MCEQARSYRSLDTAQCTLMKCLGYPCIQLSKILNGGPFGHTAKRTVCVLRRPAASLRGAVRLSVPRYAAAPAAGLISLRSDERGGDDYNMRLTDDRAHSVKNYLINKGIEANRLRAKGYGETRPVDRGHNDEAWSKNRRVEFVILKRLE